MCGVRHVAPPYFYNSAEQTNQTLALERAISVLASATALSSPTAMSQTVGETPIFNVKCLYSVFILV